jgi:alanine racemase
MYSSSHIEISKSALKFNLDFIRKIIGEESKISSVVKGNAYGHGIETFVPIANKFGVEHFSVFSAEEALRVHKSVDSQAEIMIMGMMDKAQTAWAIENDVSFFVFDFERLQDAILFSQQTGKKAKIHIEVETGMNRTGFSIKEFPKLKALLESAPDCWEFTGLCTHFAGAESIANYVRVKRQEASFRRAQLRFKKAHFVPKYNHTACSAAALRYPKTRMDMVRIGILQYGFFPSKEILIHYLTKKKEYEYPLRRVISWKSQVMSIKQVKTGEFIGYGTNYLANSDMTIATIPVGYSHGFNRSLSNQGRVLIHGQRVSVIGIVNMNMLSVDVSNLDSVKKGDEVVIIGHQGDLEISVSSFSDSSEQLNYEFLTRLPIDIPRIITE